MAQPRQLESAVNIDRPDPSPLLVARLDDWKSITETLESYVSGIIDHQKSAGKELSKLLKSLNNIPLLDGATISSEKSVPTANGNTQDGEQNGIVGGLSLLRNRIEELYNVSEESVRSLSTSVLPLLENAHKEIKEHNRGIKAATEKPSKQVEKQRALTEKSIEIFSKHVVKANIATNKPDPYVDPYVLQRNTLAEVANLLSVDNNYQDALIATEKHFETFEVHLVKSLKDIVMNTCKIQSTAVGKNELTINTVEDYFNSLHPSYDWDKFRARKADSLIPYDAKNKTLDDVTFPNINDKSTIPIIEGMLKRKEGKILKNYNTAYFVLTPGGFLHQYESPDFIKSPRVEWSLYLPECSLGPMKEGDGKYAFKVVGKAATKTITQKHTFSFQASTREEQLAWYNALREIIGGSVNEEDDSESLSKLSTATSARQAYNQAN